MISLLICAYFQMILVGARVCTNFSILMSWHWLNKIVLSCLQVDGVEMTLPFTNVTGVEVEFIRGNWLLLSTDFDLRVKWNGDSVVVVTIPEGYK